MLRTAGAMMWHRLAACVLNRHGEACLFSVIRGGAKIRRSSAQGSRFDRLKALSKPKGSHCATHRLQACATWEVIWQSHHHDRICAMLVRWGVIIFFLSAMVSPLFAHTVPTLVVETEFNAARESDIRVNIDPRLFLAAQPTKLPPIAASWWLEQDETSRAKTVADAIAYLEKTLDLRIGDAALRGGWKVMAIDSATAFPLGAGSAEVHLLAERHQQLPAIPGEFKVNVSNDCSVGVILLNSIEGKPERHPQSLFPGENSRGFKVPELKPAAPVQHAATSKETSQEKVKMRLISPFQLALLLALATLLLLALHRVRRRQE